MRLSLLLQLEQEKSSEGQLQAAGKLADLANDLGVVDFIFYLNNPHFYAEEGSWRVNGDWGASKHEAMVRGAVSLSPHPCFVTAFTAHEEQQWEYHCKRYQTLLSPLIWPQYKSKPLQQSCALCVFPARLEHLSVGRPAITSGSSMEYNLSILSCLL